MRKHLLILLALVAALSLVFVACDKTPDQPADTTASTDAPTAEPTAAPPSGPSFPCQGEDGKCTYITRSEDDPFCRKCARNDNGIEDAKE